MKKNYNQIALLLIGVVGAILFYNQFFGLNTILFSIFITVIHYYYNKKVSLPEILLNFTSIGIFLSPSPFLIILWFINILYLSKLNKKNAIIFTPIASINSAVLFIRKLIKNKAKNINLKHIIVGLISISIVAVFTFLYSLSNPLIENFLNSINLSFISGEWVLLFIFFCFVGALIISDTPLSWFRYFVFKSNLESRNQKETHEFTQIKKLTAQVTLIALVLLLTVINGVDIIVLINQTLPEGFSLSQYLHQGFFTLIFSMTLAIGLILYFFRGNINFSEDMSTLKSATYFWLAQNALLVFTTFIKNFNYILMYGLTYKRIAVILCLFIIASALFLTFIKVSQKKNLWYYLNFSSIIITIHIVIFFAIPWDLIICNYNIHAYKKNTDYTYLINLNNPDWVLLEEYKVEMNANELVYYHQTIEDKRVIYQNASLLSYNLDLIRYNKVFTVSPLSPDND